MFSNFHGAEIRGNSFRYLSLAFSMSMMRYYQGCMKLSGGGGRGVIEEFGMGKGTKREIGKKRKDKKFNTFRSTKTFFTIIRIWFDTIWVQNELFKCFMWKKIIDFVTQQNKLEENQTEGRRGDNKRRLIFNHPWLELNWYEENQFLKTKKNKASDAGSQYRCRRVGGGIRYRFS